MTDYLLDTNHASRFLAGAEPITGRIKALASGEHRFGIAITVLGELYFAAYASQRRAANLQAIRAFLADVILWPFDSATAEEFGRILAEQKAKGRPIPPLDAQIAAVARRHDLVLLTADRHFAFVTGVVVENWLA
ncbi:MAG: type II toxin-antitoxin system VapC family toxin [Chloroflexi bacterium]|jgi:predicted nucleic acid-binding protein|nr:type II toxin-antitoxin system VapC family toxin [Chloroflexota bacterium]